MGPKLETNRLTLRLFEASDADNVQTLAGDEEVARMTLSIPHPYPDGAAEAWIEHTRKAFQRGKIYSFAVVQKETGSLIGCISLRVSGSAHEAELGYWIGRPFWGRGYATEGARAAAEFGFEELNLQRIFAAAMVKNPASSNVMRKIGMKPEDGAPKQVLKNGVYEDLVHYALVKSAEQSKR